MRSPLSRLVLCAAVSLTALPAFAGTKMFSPLDHRVLEQTTLVPAAGSVTAYTVPSDAHVVLTRFCGGGCIQCEGATLGRKAFQAGTARCVEHPKGIEMPPGETVHCTNTCKTMRAALFSGLLRQ
ncbi:MAG: hypothetical protein P8R42_28065 [Candidatus Binatia bacterium]|nr:hypothetical protein [Candidatus Binatia bacterium]